MGFVLESYQLFRIALKVHDASARIFRVEVSRSQNIDVLDYRVAVVLRYAELIEVPYGNVWFRRGLRVAHSSQQFQVWGDRTVVKY